jgi:hypothetical protein
MIPILIRSHTSLRPLGRVLHPCVLCGELTRHTLLAIQTQRRLNMLVPLGEPTVAGHLATCARCELTRAVRDDVGPHHPDDTPIEELRKTTPKRLRVRVKRLRGLHTNAVKIDAEGRVARRALLTAVLADLDDAWEVLPAYDRRTKLLFAAAVAALVVGIAIGVLAGDAWLAPFAIASGIAATILIAAATWAAIVARPREARRRIIPRVSSSLARIPFATDDVETVLAAARENGSPVAVARVLRIADLVARDRPATGPYR